MNRHPYGGGGYDTSRRGGSPPSPGPDRSRFSRPPGRGGRGGGRGGGPPSYYDNNDYDDGGYSHSPQGYSMNDPSHNDSYYYQGQNQHLGGGLTPSFSNTPPPYGSYEQGYGNTVYEDKSPPDRGQYNSANRGKRPPVRKERDDKVHDTLIEERIQRERPCRTLFIRNIKYETDSNEVRRRFEEHGEIKTFFDLISNRGMVFVTYFDLRAAERARERLQGSEISGRPIDVHYSLPRGDEQNQECDREKNQGTLLVTLRNSVSGQPIDDTEVRRKFQQFGDVKTVKHVGDRPDQRYVEMYDIRACQEAHDRLRHQGLQDGVMDVIFTWDVPEMPLPPGPPPPNKREGLRDRYIDDEPRPTPRGRGGGRGGRGGPSRGGGNRDTFRDRDPRDREMDDWERDRRDDWSRDRGRRFDEGPAYKGGHGRSAAHHPDESRLEKAKKVQELLAALKQPAASSAQSPPGPSSRMPPMPPPMPPSMPPPNNPPYYPQPPATSMQQPPPFMPPNPYAYPPPPPPAPPSTAQTQHMSPPPQHQSAASALPSSLPSNILALLQQAQASQQATSQLSHQQPQQQQPAALQLPYNLPPPHVPATPPVTQNTPTSGLPPAQYQQLLAYIQSQQKRV